MQAEAYVDSVIELFKNLGVKRYCLLGRCLIWSLHQTVIGSPAMPVIQELQNEVGLVNVRHSDYQGITSILSLIAIAYPSLVWKLAA